MERSDRTPPARNRPHNLLTDVPCQSGLFFAHLLPWPFLVLRPLPSMPFHAFLPPILLLANAKQICEVSVAVLCCEYQFCPAFIVTLYVSNYSSRPFTHFI